MDFHFTKALAKLFFEQETPVADEDTTVPTAFEQESFDAAVTSEAQDVAEIARQQIIASQEHCDTDDLPDIGNVLRAVETAGTGDDHQLIRRILQNFGGHNPDDLVQDGNNRKNAIERTIKNAQNQGNELKALKATENQALLQAETDAGTTCTQKINEINTACDEAIAEEMRRSKEIIDGLRKQAEDSITAAKQERDEELARIAEARDGNNAAIRSSALYVEAIETEGARAIAETYKYSHTDGQK